MLEAQVAPSGVGSYRASRPAVRLFRSGTSPAYGSYVDTLIASYEFRLEPARFHRIAQRSSGLPHCASVACARARIRMALMDSAGTTAPERFTALRLFQIGTMMTEVKVLLF